MKAFLIEWIDGHTTTVIGTNIANAYLNYGYGAAEFFRVKTYYILTS